ncbi:Smr/MutS family protein [Candidatus Dojkabacteria bacterium]|nr:Smr/MutS family protein [Candidatus Dojkabacteria bacterium]
MKQIHQNKYKKYSKAQITKIDPVFVADAKLDYHDRGSMTPYEIETILNEFLENSYSAGYHNVLIITGKGQIVRPLIKSLLPKHKLVSRFKFAGYFNGQTGAFEVWLRD